MEIEVFAPRSSDAAEARRASDRPNILWIVADDLSPALGAYGDAFATTPHLDRFAKESVKYTHAFATSPVCSPSRACLINGLYDRRVAAGVPRAEAHNDTFTLMCGLLLVGLVANLLVRPVHSKHYLVETS